MSIFIIRVIALLILTCIVPIGMGVIFHFGANPLWVLMVGICYLISMVALIHIPDSRR